MKRLLSLAIAMVMGIAAYAQPENGPKLVIDDPDRDFGTLYTADSVKVFIVNFRNEGDADLYIEEIATSCHCLKIRNVSDYEKVNFPPGSAATLIVDFNLDLSPQEFCKEIFFYSNASPKGETIDVHLRGTLINGKRN